MGDLSPNFNRSEFACRCGCGFDTVDAGLIVALESVRHHLNAPVSISSGCRCKSHNSREGGGDKSQHLYGRAADITVKDVTADKVHKFLMAKYNGKYGIGRYSSWTHIDTRSGKPARW